MARKGMREITTPLQEGKELELSLLGPSFANRHDPEKENNLNFTQSIQTVKKDLDYIEHKGDKADEDSADFIYAELTTNPKHNYIAKLYDELCKHFGFDDIKSKKLRFYNTIDTVLDIRFGTDFFFEIDPSILKDKFGESAERLKQPIIVTVDVTLDPEKPSPKADVILFYENIPESRSEQEAFGKKAAAKIMEFIADKYRLPYEKEKPEKAPEKKAKREIVQIRKSVHKRVKKVA